MHALLSKFLDQLSNAECRGLETAYKDSRQMFLHSDRMLEQILQISFKISWRVSFSNEDFKTVQEGLASLAIVKIWTWAFLDQDAAQSVECEEGSKKISFCFKSKRVIGKW